MSEAAERHAGLVARLRHSEAASDRLLDAFARVPRHLFLPGTPLEAAYADDAIVTQDEAGIPTSSSSQPSLMARMIEMLDVGPGARVLEIGAGTGYNAAVLAAMGAAVTSVELVRVVAGDGAAPPDGPYDRVIVTAGCWALPARLVNALADGGLLVAPLRVNGVELAVALRRYGDILRAVGGVPCGFMPLRGGEERPWRWSLASECRHGRARGGTARRLLARRARAGRRGAPRAGGTRAEPGSPESSWRTAFLHGLPWACRRRCAGG